MKQNKEKHQKNYISMMRKQIKDKAMNMKFWSKIAEGLALAKENR